MTASRAVIAGAVRRDDARGTAVGDDDLAHILAGEHGAAMILDAADQCLGQLAAAADRHAESIGLEEAQEHEYAEAGRLFIRRHQVLAGHAGEMRAHPIVLEIVRQHIVAAHLHGAPELAALAALIEERETRRPAAPAAYRASTPASAATPPPAPTGAGRPRRRAGENLAICAADSVRIPVQRQGRAILEHRHHRRFRKQVPQSIAALQSQLIPLQQRIGLDEDMRHGMLIVAKAGQRELARDHAAAQPRIAFQHQHALAGSWPDTRPPPARCGRCRRR